MSYSSPGWWRKLGPLKRLPDNVALQLANPNHSVFVTENECRCYMLGREYKWEHNTNQINL